MSVARPPSPITVARRSVVASAGDQSTASLTSPPSLTHSASTPGGTRSWPMPGATLTSERRVSRSSTHGHGGVQPSTSKTRPRPPRRAGSAKAASKPLGSIVVASPTCTAPARPEGGEVGPGHRHAHRVVVDAGRDQPGPGEGEEVAADAAAEVDRRCRPGSRRPAVRRGGRRPAARVACSSASGVKNIRCAASPNLATAFARSCACVVAAAAFSASGSRRRTTLATRTGSPAWSAQAWAASTSRRAPSARPQPVQRRDLHARHPVRRQRDTG